MKTKLDIAKEEALKLIRAAQRLLLNAVPSSGGTTYSALPDRERQMVDCLAMAQTLGEPIKSATLGRPYGEGIMFSSGIKSPTEAVMRKTRCQNLRIAKAAKRMSGKLSSGQGCPRG